MLLYVELWLKPPEDERPRGAVDWAEAGRVPLGGRAERYSALFASEKLSVAAWRWKLDAAASLTAFSSCLIALLSANMPWLEALVAALANSLSVNMS